MLQCGSSKIQFYLFLEPYAEYGGLKYIIQVESKNGLIKAQYKRTNYPFVLC